MHEAAEFWTLILTVHWWPGNVTMVKWSELWWFINDIVYAFIVLSLNFDTGIAMLVCLCFRLRAHLCTRLSSSTSLCFWAFVFIVSRVSILNVNCFSVCIFVWIIVSASFVCAKWCFHCALVLAFALVNVIHIWTFLVWYSYAANLFLLFSFASNQDLFLCDPMKSRFDQDECAVSQRSFDSPAWPVPNFLTMLFLVLFHFGHQYKIFSFGQFSLVRLPGLFFTLFCIGLLLYIYIMHSALV